MLGTLLQRWFRPQGAVRPQPLSGELLRLEDRTNPATVSLLGGNLSVLGTSGNDFLQVVLQPKTNQVAVVSSGVVIGQFANASITQITMQGLSGKDRLEVDSRLTQPATLDGGAGRDTLIAGGGSSILLGDEGIDKLISGPGVNTLNAGTQADYLFGVTPTDTVIATAAAQVVSALPVINSPVIVEPVLNQTDVDYLLQRAAAATASDDAIIAIVDRNGVLLGLRIEGGVDPAITSNPDLLVYAVDGALAKARTAAFFGNNQAPLTSRTVQFISQTTMTQREIEAYPSITDPNSTMRGPGFVAPVGLAGHFPPNIKYTPQVDLFAIEHTNRDSIVGPGPDRIKGTPDDVTYNARFNINPAFLGAGVTLESPESYGMISGYQPGAQSRGLATLPGGIPIYKPSETAPNPPRMVGGIGVFFPGKTGFATEENSALSTMFDPSKPDRSFEAEYIAYAALGGVRGGIEVGALGSVALNPTFQLPSIAPNRIDLVGITLDIFGPGGVEGPTNLVKFGKTLGIGDPFSGANYRVTNNPALTPLSPTIYNPDYFKIGKPVPDGWLVMPHNGVGVTAAQVVQMVDQGIQQADKTRSAIRLPLNQSAKMVFAVSDLEGNIVGLYRMPDATVFSIDVAVAKARNLAYYNNPAKLQPIDQLPGLPVGAAITNRTVRYASLPRFPEGIDGNPPGPFSILNDGNVNPFTGVQVGPRLPASAFQSIQGYDAFNPGTNFHDPFNINNQNGVVFFPGSSGVYTNGVLIGGLGISGDGVDQDDVITSKAIVDFNPNPGIRADQFRVRGIRLPYNKFNRNPEGGVIG